MFEEFQSFFVAENVDAICIKWNYKNWTQIPNFAILVGDGFWN